MVPLLTPAAAVLSSTPHCSLKFVHPIPPLHLHHRPFWWPGFQPQPYVASGPRKCPPWRCYSVSLLCSSLFDLTEIGFQLQCCGSSSWRWRGNAITGNFLSPEIYCGCYLILLDFSIDGCLHLVLYHGMGIYVRLRCVWWCQLPLFKNFVFER